MAFGTVVSQVSPSDWLKGENEGAGSRANVRLLAGDEARTLASGTLLAEALAAEAVVTTAGGNVGNGELGPVVIGPGAKPGVYQVVIIEPAEGGGSFSVEDPDGALVGTGEVGVEFAGGGLAFTVTAGDADFEAGDRFMVGVDGLEKYVPVELAGGGGDAAALLLLGVGVPAGAMARGVAIFRDAVIAPPALSWPDGAGEEFKAAALANLERRRILGRPGGVGGVL